MARWREQRITKWLESDDVSVFNFRRFLSLISRSVVFQLHYTLDFVSPRIHCIWLILDYTSTSHQRLMDMNTITANIRIRAMRGSYLLTCWQRYGYLLVCDSYIQSFTITLHCLQLTVCFYFVGKVKPTQCYFRFSAINRTNKLTCETDEILVTVMKFFYFTNNTHIMTQKL